MYCNQCGNILTEQGAFCSFCGAKNEDVTVKPPTSEAAQATTTANEAAAPVNEPVTTASAPNTQPAAQTYVSPAAPTGYANEVPMNVPPATQPQKEEKYYTFNHILLCLGAVAVMAIVAGVFAGLYFSTI